MTLEKKNSNAEVNVPDQLDTEREHKRLRFIDQGRGFIVLYLVITLVFPPEVWKEADFSIILHYIFDHAPRGATYMTLYDVGAAAFIFILGILLNVAYRRRVEEKGKNKAIMHVLIRYGVLFVLGALIVVVDQGLYKVRYDYVLGYEYIIIGWDVLPSIAVAGLIAFLFISIRNPLYRLIVGYGWGLIYQILMVTTFFKDYAILSSHGGIFGSIFGYASISIIASAVGDYLVDPTKKESMKYWNLLIFALINYGIGIGINFIPGWEASKRQVSFAHNLISIGVTCFGLFIFSLMDRKLNWELKYLRAFGMYPFFVYFISELPIFLLDMTIGVDLGIEIWGNFIMLVLLLTYTSLLVLWLYKKKKSFSTIKAALIFLAVAIAIAAIGIPLGLF
ncbi:MAG: hypothetical protein JW776_05595 [Candidatus Lokiarchaeota archaeon]|nr:hypothetical protein [Candidatus Lokiarchaeota archaeon]